MITSETFEKAIRFAVKKHKGQKRKGDGRPYILHPISVMVRVQSVKKSKNIWLLGAAAILHDTVEDCGVSIKTIAKKFGFQIASIVEELTLDKSNYTLLGKSEYLLAEMKKMSSYALTIKLCDRMDNVCDLDDMPEEFVKRYTDETKYILDNLCKDILTETQEKLISQIYNQLKIYGS